MSSIRSTLRRLAPAAVATVSATTLATAVLTAPAHADARTFHDAHGDMAHGADIHRVRVLNDDVVKVRVVHENLRPTYRTGSSVAIYLDTRPRQEGPEFAFLGATHSGGDYALLRTDGWRIGRTAEPMRCSYRLRLDYEADVAAVTIGRGCLDRPGKVRVAVKTGGYTTGGDTRVDWLGERRELTAWVARG